MRKIENYEEFIGVWNENHKNRYWGNKKISIEQEQDIIQRANVADFKRYNIYVLDDGNYIVIDTKWSIDRNLYYDDELDAPEITLEYFKKKNEMNIAYSEIEYNDYEKPYLMKSYGNNSKQVGIVKGKYNYEGNLQWAKSKDLFVRYLSEEEINEYNEIVRELIKKYDERLEKYFKKYRDKIYAIGYWVNR